MKTAPPSLPSSATKNGKKSIRLPVLSLRSERILLWILLLAYISFVATGISRHELWRDEGCDWMAVRDLGLTDLLSWYIPQGGHPPLYYFILFPLAKAGLPLMTVNIVSLVFMTASVYLLFFRIKFPLFFRIALACSFFFLYEYSVIGRNYCVVVFCLMLLLAIYPKRMEKPWPFAIVAACLLNADSLLFSFTMAIVALYWFELWQQKKLQQSFVLPAAFMTIAGLYLIPYIATTGMETQASVSAIEDHFAAISAAVSRAFIVYHENEILFLVFIVIVLLLMRTPKALFLLITGSAGILYLLGYVRAGDVRHSGILLLMIIGAYGIASHYAAEKKEGTQTTANKPWKAGLICLSCFFAYQAFVGYNVWKQDLNGNFSGGKDAAAFITKNKLEHRIIIGQPSWAASAVMQYLPEDCKIYYADCQRYGTFIIYDSLYEANQFHFSVNYAPYIAARNFATQQDGVLLLLNSPITNKKSAVEWELIYATKDIPMKKQESFFIYSHRK